MGIMAPLRSLQQSASFMFKRASKVKAAVSAIGALTPEQSRAVSGRVAAKLLPFVRSQLEASYQASGMATRSGTLRRASATNAIIELTPNGFFISMARGAKYGRSHTGKAKGNVYAAAYAHKYGAIRQPLTKAKGTLYEDLPTGKMVARKKAAGEYGGRKKRTIKKIAAKAFSSSGQTDLGKGVHYIPPDPPFFTLSKAQMKLIQERQAQLVKAELAKLGVIK